ncbi:MAG: DNA internalization-related competence protein ComEC/Rec2 [Lachnospiraceae bacterium]|nr:DNA internalization-related competence protein ComEC/Rec2 [Lachnospiraceae bacterium]
MKRPMLYWAVLFILGEVSYKIFSINEMGIYVIAAIVFLYAVIVFFRYKNNAVLLIGVFFFCGGALCFGYQSKQLILSELYCGKMISVKGTVIQKTEKGQSTEYVIKTKTVGSERLHTKIILSYEEELTLGDLVVLQGEAVSFSNAVNPGQYDEKAYQNGNGIFIKLEHVVLKETVKKGIGIRRLLKYIHNQLRANYEMLFDEQHASLAGAMVLGDKASIDADIKRLYQQNGIAHLIAISGLHIAMIGGTLYRVLRKCLGYYNLAAGFGIGFIFAYGLMTGLSGSTIRAIIMLIIQIGADVFGRKYDSISSIALALCVMLVCNPYQITQAGFLLSFGAIVGIAVVNPVWKQWFKGMPHALEGIMLSISVQLTILPVMLYYFYEIAVYGVILNVVVVPMMSLLLALLLLCGIMGFVCYPLAVIFAIPAEYIFSFYDMLCKYTEKLPFHTVCSGRPSVCWIAGYYILLAVFVWCGFHKSKASRILLSVVLVGIVVLFPSFWLPGKLKICMFDVGQGDGIYIRTPEKIHILMDGGSSSKQKVGSYVLKNGVKYYGAGEIDYVFISHLDNDHYSGVMELLETKEVKIKNIVLPDIANPDEAYWKLENLGRQSGCSLIYMKRGDYIKIGEVIISCLNPLKKEYDDKNSGSLVFQLNFKEFDMLLTGDITQSIEQDILPYVRGSIEVLKVAHHGSKTASGEDFVRHLSPALAMISVGKNNRYGHPSQAVMEILNKYCDNIYLTKDSGAITIDSDGFCYWIQEFLESGVNR